VSIKYYKEPNNKPNGKLRVDGAASESRVTSSKEWKSDMVELVGFGVTKTVGNDAFPRRCVASSHNMDDVLRRQIAGACHTQLVRSHAH